MQDYTRRNSMPRGTCAAKGMPNGNPAPTERCHKMALLASEQMSSGMAMGKDNSWWWEWLWLVLGRLDGRSLAAAGCVSRSWCDVARQEELWRCVCLATWPGLVASCDGMNAVNVAGGYRNFYSMRQRAQSLSGSRRPSISPKLRLEDLFFMLDVHHRDSPVCSIVRGGESLKPMFPAAAGCIEHGLFRFVVELPPSSDTCQCDSVRFNALYEAPDVWIGNTRWSKSHVKEFTISWAVMVKGSPKLLQILHTREAGQIVGNSCNYSERLQNHSCCLTETKHVVEVDLYFSHGDARDCQSLSLRELRCSILNTDCWRYFTQPQALQYLQHALFHDCKDY